MKLMNRSNPSAASAPRSTAWRVGVMVALVSWSAAAQAADRPNIVFIYVDDVSEAALGCYGSVFGPTPHIDRLAEQGVRFTQSFVGNSICGPARATVLTGTHSHVNGRTSNQSEFNRGLPTWPKRLQRGGYQTAMLGKWHLPGEPMGFDYWAITQGYYLDKFNSSDGPATRPGYTTDVLTDLTHEWIAARDPEKPFAVWVNHSAAHRTWMPPPRLLARYDGETLPEPTTLRDDYTGRSAAAYETQMRIARDLFPAYDLKLPVTGEGILDGAARRNLSRLSAEQRAAWDAAYGPKNAAFERADLRGDALVAWKYQRYIKDYLRCVAAIDQSVGATLGFLESAGLADNTVVVFSSDQGFFLGEHGWYDKRWMYEPALRTPLVVRWPGITAPGGTVDAMVQNIDMAPTLIDIAGAEPVDGMQGRSLAPLLRGDTPDDWRDAIYYHYHQVDSGRTAHTVARHYGVRTERHKLIRVYDHDAWELYDLRADPHEMNNVYDDPAYEAVVARLKERLIRLRREYRETTGPEVEVSRPQERTGVGA